jgi:membrane-bound ClpP family serine protease
VVLITIDPMAATGIVRIGGEEWRATTDGEIIEEGAVVAVKEVRGARLLVAAVEESPQ